MPVTYSQLAHTNTIASPEFNLRVVGTVILIGFTAAVGLGQY